jgi:hypothetical protein
VCIVDPGGQWFLNEAYYQVDRPCNCARLKSSRLHHTNNCSDLSGYIVSTAEDHSFDTLKVTTIPIPSNY